MGGKGGSNVNPPNPYQTAEAQSNFFNQAARTSATYNQMGVNSPYGRQYYTGDIGDPNRQMNIELSPEQQKMLDYQQRLSTHLLGYGVGEMLPNVRERLNAPDSTAVEDAMYQRGLERITPEYERGLERTQSNLMSGGIPVGSRAYGQEMDRIDERRGQDLENLALSSQIAGATENRAQRQQAIAELSGLIGMAPGMQGPATMMPGQTQVGAPDFMGASNAQYQGRLANQQMQANQLGGMYGLLGTLGGAYMLGGF